MAVSSTDENSQGEFDETKSGNLMVCAGSSGRLLHQLTTASGKKCERCFNRKHDEKVDTDLRTLLGKMSRNKTISTNMGVKVTSRTDISGLHEKQCQQCGINDRKSGKKLQLSKTVKVCVYTKGSNHYLVIYDSTAKFASIVLNQRLRKFRVQPTSVDNDESEDAVESKRFRIYPNMSDDVIIFQASTKSQRDEWMSYLGRLTQSEISGVSSPRKTNHHLMKSSLSTLEEAEEPSDELQSERLKARTRRQKSREGRKNSLTGIGVRLLRRPLARSLA